MSVSGTSATPLGVFESGIQNRPVLHIELILLHRRQLFVDPEFGFGDDLNDVAQVLRRAEFDRLLLRPRHVMRPEQPIASCRKLDACTWIRKQKFLAHRHIQHAA
jgi:hypothetical protein